jgi:hypothetical protein
MCAKYEHPRCIIHLRLKMLSNLFRGHESAEEVPQIGSKSLFLSEIYRLAYIRSDAGGSWDSDDPRTEDSDETAMRMAMAFLPHTFIISDLGEWNAPKCLFFSHFLPDCPSLAVFARSQDVPISSSWRRGQGWQPWWLKLRCRWHEGRLQIRPPCAAKAIVEGGRWQRKVPSKAVRYWDDRAEMLLVDWNAIWGDCST